MRNGRQLLDIHRDCSSEVQPRIDGSAEQPEDLNNGPPRLVSIPASGEASQSTHSDIVLVDNRSFMRECIVRSLKTFFPDRVVSFPSLGHWLEVSESYSASIVLLSVSGKPGDESVQKSLEALTRSTDPLPVILLCDAEEPDQILAALDRGARGYIPTSISLDVAAQAVRLVMAGGVFVPASSLIAARRSDEAAAPASKSNGELFTARQAAVVEAIRRGKANKIIAYELNMCESTVKVHVRNIMKKLKVRNRTEVAFIAHSLLSGTNSSEQLATKR